MHAAEVPSPLLQTEQLHKNARQSRKLCAIACLPAAAPPRLNYIPPVKLPVTAAGVGLHQDSDTSDDGLSAGRMAPSMIQIGT